MMGAVAGRWGAATVFVAGVVAAALASGGVGMAPEPRAFDVASPPDVVSCPGPQQVPVGDVGEGGELASEPTSRIFSVFSPETTTEVGLGVSAATLVAAQVERIDDGDIEGWSALTCGGPAFEQWLVGGATTLGASARLVLSNPSDAPSEATVTFYGALGKVEDTAVISVAAGEQVDTLVEATAVEEAALVVHVVATGPGVVASLQDSRLEGFQPAGTAWVGPSAAGESLVIPGLGFEMVEAFATVRIMAPEGATAGITLVSEQGVQSWSAGRRLTLEPGVVIDIDVPVDGLLAVQIEADGPVVAAARTVVPRLADEGLEGDVAYDHEWMPAMNSAASPRSAVVPSASARVVAFAPLGGTFTLTDATGAVVHTQNLPPRAVQWVDIDVAAGTVISSDDAVAWGLVYASAEDGLLAALAPTEVGQESLSATVVPSTYGPGRNLSSSEA